MPRSPLLSCPWQEVAVGGEESIGEPGSAVILADQGVGEQGARHAIASAVQGCLERKALVPGDVGDQRCLVGR